MPRYPTKAMQNRFFFSVYLEMREIMPQNNSVVEVGRDHCRALIQLLHKQGLLVPLAQDHIKRFLKIA